MVENIKILIGPQFLGTPHSWCVVGWGLATAFLEKGHQVHLCSTDGKEKLPQHLLPYLLETPKDDYDLQIAYTAPPNWANYFRYGKKKVAIWTYEWIGKDHANVLPTGWAKYHLAVDYIAAPSNFSRQIFIDAGMPADKIVVIPHGIDAKQFGKDIGWMK